MPGVVYSMVLIRGVVRSSEVFVRVMGFATKFGNGRLFSLVAVFLFDALLLNGSVVP